MPDYPFALALQVTLTASGVGSVSYNVSPGESLAIGWLNFTATGAFGITDIRLGSGRRFTNASSSVYLPSVNLQNGANANIGLNYLLSSLVVDGGDILYIDILDTSGSGNTVKFVLLGTKTSG